MTAQGKRETRNYKFSAWCDPALMRYEVFDVDTREIVATFPYKTELDRGTASGRATAEVHERNDKWRATLTRSRQL